MRDRKHLSGRIAICLIALLFLVPFAANALPNGTETLITTDTAGTNQFFPAVNGDIIAWEDQQTYSNVYIYNLANGEEYLAIPDPNLDQIAPSVYGSRVVWGQHDTIANTYSIVIFHTVTRTAEFVTAVPGPGGGWMREDNAFPKIYSDSIVWQDYTSGSDWDIYTYNTTWGTLISAPLISDPAFDQKNPALSGNYLVYENWTGSNSDIWAYNFSDASTVEITSTGHAERPDISGDTIVWQDAGSIFRYSISTGVTTEITPSGSGILQQNPAIDDNRIVLEDTRRSSNADIYLYDVSSGTEVWVSPQAANAAQTLPRISGNRIVWQDMRSSGVSDIYLFTLGTSDTCPVADFSASLHAGPDPSTVVFTDQSVGSPILYRTWNYSDGTTSYPMDPSGQIFNGAGIYHTRLTVGNTKCRNTTPAAAEYDIYIDTHPEAGFTATPLEGFAPLAVQFTDISGGDPVSWAWDFGDGTHSHEQNPRHTYTTEGQSYTVSLVVNNTYDSMSTDTEVKNGYVRTFLGATGTATIPIEGIVVIPRYGGWFLLYNATMLPDMVRPDPTVLTAFHPGTSGWQNITFLSSDAVGFTDAFGNNTYMGNLSRVFFQTDDVTASGVSPALGSGWGVNYMLMTSGYPSPASISTAIWENTTPADRDIFRRIIIGSNFIETSNGIAYTARIVKTGIRGDGNATINMSVDSTWLGGQEANTYIVGYGMNYEGDTVGKVTPARYLFTAGTLDYFEAEVPEYFSTFGIGPLTGSGNPFQLITLSVTSHVNPPAPNVQSSESDSGMPSGGPAVTSKTTIPTTAPTTAAAPADLGKSAKVFTNAQGVVTQATLLTSTDGRVTISIPEGVVAKDAGGKPLAEISIRAVPPGDLPEVPSGSVFTFAGMAYEIGPDGATFSPPVTFTFSPPETGLGKEYSVKSFDKSSGTWKDLPTTFDAATGTVTVQVSHLCCFALFTQAIVQPVVTATPASLPVPAATLAKAQPPSSAVSIFMSMMGWMTDLVIHNLVLIVGGVILAIVVFLIVQDRSPRIGR